MLKLFSGTANLPLAQEVARIMGITLSSAEVVSFGNSETRVRIVEKVKNTTCVVIQPTANPTDKHLMELFFFCDALRRNEAAKVIGVIPYFGYARQDIQHREGECVSANVVIRFIETIGFSKIYTVNIHDEATQGVFSIPYKDLSALELLASQVRQYKEGIDPLHTVILSPDQGGVERARKFGEALFHTDEFALGVVEKKRNMEKIHTSQALDLHGNVSGKTVILVDDMITSGGTLVNAAQMCKQRGASAVLAVVVHHDFADSAPAILQASAVERFFVTNTILLPAHHRFDKLHEASVAGLIAHELGDLLKK